MDKAVAVELLRQLERRFPDGQPFDETSIRMGVPGHPALLTALQAIGIGLRPRKTGIVRGALPKNDERKLVRWLMNMADDEEAIGKYRFDRSRMGWCRIV
ncbi:MAG TPA: hypothetical protein VGD41_14220 [Pyrinomonadaceae bacterium]